jgi:hypothetical protein
LRVHANREAKRQQDRGAAQAAQGKRIHNSPHTTAS